MDQLKGSPARIVKVCPEDLFSHHHLTVRRYGKFGGVGRLVDASTIKLSSYYREYLVRRVVWKIRGVRHSRT